MHICEKCGSVYEEAEVRRSGRCEANTDGGGVCRGAIVPAAVNGGRVVPAVSVGGSFRAPGGLQTHESLSRVLAEALGRPGVSGLLRRCEMRRGAILDDGKAVAVIVFANAEDRAEFANLVIAAEGRVTAG